MRKAGRERGHREIARRLGLRALRPALCRSDVDGRNKGFGGLGKGGGGAERRSLRQRRLVAAPLPLRERRRKLEAFARRYLRKAPRFRLSPATTDVNAAKAWLKDVGAMLDGIIAKRCDLDYRSGERTGMQKVKNYRSADCVVGGFRYNEGKPVVGSLLLGLYGEDGLLHHVGFTSTIRSGEKKALTLKLKRLVAPPGFSGNAPGGPSRWSTGRSAQWQPLKPRLVVEVQYDHFSGHRFRHGTKFLRWRPDKSPRQCTMDQVAQKKANLARLLT